MKNQVDDVVYVRCLTEMATIIGKRNFQPQTAPVEVPETEYKAFKGLYDHYEEHGTLALEHPNSKQFAISARQAKAAQRIAEETDAQGEMPPPSIEIPSFGMTAPMKEQMARSGMRKASINPDFCRAKRADGLQCHTKPRKGHDFCGFHSKMVVNGREVKDMDGNLVKLEDVE